MMQPDFQILNTEEAVALRLRSLYRKSGYTHYKMSKFEEYELYVHNKEFLISDNVITFNDTNGRLLALKPDVTLSIVKNSRDGGALQKVYYNENVYRVSKSTHCFKEIMQAGLECIGDIDDCCQSEVVALAIRSLECVSEQYALDISHIGVLSALLEQADLSGDKLAAAVKCIGEKNVHDLKQICSSYGVEQQVCDDLISLIKLRGSFNEISSELEAICKSTQAKEALCELRGICTTLDEIGLGDKVSIDFSIVNDMDYYSGIIFRGYVDGVPSGVLSGGKYDGLMQKMGKPGSAIGFALYLDELERLNVAQPAQADALLLYDKSADSAKLLAALDALRAGGKSAAAWRRDLLPRPSARQEFLFENGEVRQVEADD